MSRTLTSIVAVLICVLSVTSAHAADVAVTIQGADKPTLTLPAPKKPDDKPSVAWSQTYYVYVDNTTDAVAVEEPVVQRAQDATGGQVAVTYVLDRALGTKPEAKKPLSYTVTLSATFEKAGEYTTNMRVFAADKVATKAITIVVTAAAPPVAAAAPAPVDALVQVDKGGKQLEAGDWPFFSEPRTVVLTVRNTTKSDVIVSATSLVMTQKTSSGHTIDVPSGVTGVVIEGQADKTIPAEGTARVNVTVDKLESPAHYEGVVRLTPMDTTKKPVDLSFEIFLRHPWWICALLIAIGAIVAYRVRNRQDRHRAAQVRRIELASIAERLKAFASGAVTSQAVAVGRTLLVHVREFDDRIERREEAVLAEANNPIKTLASRVALYGKFVEIDATVARLPQATREPKRKTLDEVASTITNDQADAAGITKGYADLNTIGARDAERKYLETWLATLTGDVASHVAGGDPALASAVDTEIEPALALARDESRRDDLAKLAVTLDRAQRALVRHGADALSRAMKVAAGGVDAAEWSKLTTDLAARIAKLDTNGETDALIAQYAQIRAAYVIAVARGTVVVADSFLKDPAISPAWSQSIKTMRDTLSTATSANPPDTNVISRATVSLRDALRQNGVPIASRAQDYHPNEVSTRPERPQESVASFRASRDDDGDWRKMQEALRISDLMIFGVVTAIGILAGLKLLWVNNATWGGAMDVVTALLWGAGVNASKDQFMGLLKLRSDLGK